MWFLYKLDNENGGEGMVYCRLRPNKTYSIGRKGVDIMIYNDKSISKHHGSIRTDPMAVEKLDDVNDKPQLYYTDNSSKYGTKINNQKVTETTELNESDVLSLGSFGLNLRVHWVPFVLCRQGITSGDKRNLFLLASSLGVHIVNEWSPECTHLLVTNFTATGKVLHCFVDAKPMVTPEWLGNALHANDMDFDPAAGIDPQTIRNYGPLKKDILMGVNEDRKITFAHKVFYFFEKDQFIANQYLIEKLGGAVEMKDLNRFDTVNEVLRSKNQPILVEPPVHKQQEDAWVALALQLNECDIRVIPEYEIGYAIIYGSSNIACHPKAFANHIEAMERHHHQHTTSQASLGNFTFDFSLTMASFQNDSTLSPSLVMQGNIVDGILDDMVGEPSNNTVARPVKQEPVEDASLSLGSLLPQKRSLPPTTTPNKNARTSSGKGKEPAPQNSVTMIDDEPGPSTRKSTTGSREDDDGDDLFSDIFSMRPSCARQTASGSGESSGSRLHQKTLPSAQNEGSTLPSNDAIEKTLPYNTETTQPYHAETTLPYNAEATQPISADRTQPYNAEKTLHYNTQQTLPYGEPSNMDRTIPYNPNQDTVPLNDATIPYTEDDKTVPYDNDYPSINMDDGQHEDDGDFNILDSLELTQPHRDTSSQRQSTQPHRATPSSSQRQSTQPRSVAPSHSSTQRSTTSLQRDVNSQNKRATQHQPPAPDHLDSDDEDWLPAPGPTRNSIPSSRGTQHSATSSLQRDANDKSPDKRTDGPAHVDDQDEDFDWLMAPEPPTPRNAMPSARVRRGSTQPVSTQGTTDQRTQPISTLDTRHTSPEPHNPTKLDDIVSENASPRRRVLPTSLSATKRRSQCRSLEASLPNPHSEVPSSPPRSSTPVENASLGAIPQASPVQPRTNRSSTPVSNASLGAIPQASPVQPRTNRSSASTRQSTLGQTVRRTTNRNTQTPNAMTISPLETEENNTPLPDIEPGKRYMVVEYAPLVVASIPPPQAVTPVNDGINYKRFKKVQQFRDQALLDVVNLVSNTQLGREERNAERREAATISSDPDLFIRSRTRPRGL